MSEKGNTIQEYIANRVYDYLKDNDDARKELNEQNERLERCGIHACLSCMNFFNEDSSSIGCCDKCYKNVCVGCWKYCEMCDRTYCSFCIRNVVFKHCSACDMDICDYCYDKKQGICDGCYYN